MTTPARLALFAAAVAVAFALGFGVGDLAGPLGDDRPAPAPAHDMTEDHR
jgi:hypothetical protein